MDLPTRLDYFAIGRDYAIQRSTKLDPAQVDVAGSDANLFVGIASVLAATLTRHLAYRVAALTLDGAVDEDLDRLGYDRYNLVRKGASPARGTIKITRTGTTAGAGSVPIGTVVVTTTGVEYVTTTVAQFSAASVSETCNVRAVQAGKATQVGKEQIRRFQKPQLLWDGTLEVTNEAATAGGEERESDDLFRSRIRDFWRSARRGVKAAIEAGAKTVPGVVSAQAIEALTTDGQPARVVNLYIADSSGVASDALAEEVLVALEDYRACGIAVLISTSLPLLVDVELALAFQAGVDTRTFSDQVRAAVVEYVNSLPVNGPLYSGSLFSVLQRFESDGLIPREESVLAPVGDLVPAIGQTLRTTLANVRLN